MVASSSRKRLMFLSNNKKSRVLKLYIELHYLYSRILKQKSMDNYDDCGMISQCFLEREFVVNISITAQFHLMMVDNVAKRT